MESWTKFNKSHQKEVLIGVSSVVVLGAGFLLYYYFSKSKKLTDLTTTTTMTTSTTSSTMQQPSNVITPPEEPKPDEETSIQAKNIADVAAVKYKEKKFEDAIKGFTEALDLDKENFRFYTNRAMAYLQLKNYEMVYQDAAQSVKIHPTAKGYYTLGRGAMGLQKYEDAKEQFKKVLEFNDESMSDHAKKSITKCEKMLDPDRRRKKVPKDSSTKEKAQVQDSNEGAEGQDQSRQPLG